MDITEIINKVNNGEILAGYKKEHGYIVPVDWQVVPISKITTQVERKTERPNKPYWKVSIRSHCKGTFQVYIEDYKQIKMEKLYIVHENDLIVNITFAWEHAIAIADKKDNNLLVSKRFPTFVFKNNACIDFYRNVIKSKYIKYQLGVFSPGGAGRNRVLNTKLFYNSLYLPFPPLKEQENIAKILQCCNKIITLKEELLKEKEKYKKYVMRELISGKIIREKFGVCVKKLDFASICCNAQLNNKYKNNENNKEYYPVIDQGEQFISGYSNDITKVIECPHDGYVLYGDHTRVVKYINFNFIVSGDGVKLFKAKKNIYTLFLYYLFCNEYVPSLGYSRHLKILKKRYFCIPPLKEQHVIITILTKIDNEIELLKKELELYKEKFKALSQILITGIIRTNNLSEK